MNDWARRNTARKLEITNLTGHNVRWTLAVLLATLTLSACATGIPGIGHSTPTGSASAACIAMKPINLSRGKPGGPTTEDIAAALDRDHPIERVRNLVGDTSSTLEQVDISNASLNSLCGRNGNGSVAR